jgi:hypothetical protein
MVKTSTGWHYIDINEQTIGENNYQKTYNFSPDGIAAFVQGKNINFLRADGTVIEPELKAIKLLTKGMFGKVQGFNDGLIAVRQGKRWGYLDKNGKIAIDIKYTEVSSFNNGFATVKYGNKFFVIDTNGKETLIDIPGIIRTKQFTEMLAPYMNDAKLYGFINTQGKEIIRANFKGVGYFRNGLAWARDVSGLIGFIDKEGNWVIKPQFEAAKNFDATSGLARVKKNGNWMYVDREGKLMEIKTELYGDFYEGLAKGKQNGLVGFFDAAGVWVIKPKFENARDFHNGYAAAKYNGKWGIIDTAGNWVIQPSYLGIRDIVKID